MNTVDSLRRGCFARLDRTRCSPTPAALPGEPGRVDFKSPPTSVRLFLHLSVVLVCFVLISTLNVLVAGAVLGDPSQLVPNRELFVDGRVLTKPVADTSVSFARTPTRDGAHL